MKKVYHLPQCGTCQRILTQYELLERGFELQDIKKQPILATELDGMKEMIGSYAALFSKRAIKYKTMGLKDRVLTESEYRSLILEDYTFLKRPVIIDGSTIYVGSEQKTMDLLAASR